MLLSESLRRVVRTLRGQTLTPQKAYDPENYWEARAEGDIRAADDPECYAQRGWPRRGGELEAEVVPRLLSEAGVETVLVPGAGTGAQYVYLLENGFRPYGFDISPTRAAICRERFPDVSTDVGNVVGAEQRMQPADAVVVAAVLQHVRPDEIDTAVASLKVLARKLIVIRELTGLDGVSNYQFAHDYRAHFADWREVHREIADAAARYRSELIAWKHPDVWVSALASTARETPKATPRDV